MASHCGHLIPNTQFASAIVCRKQVPCLTTGREPQRWRFPETCKMRICDMPGERQRASNPVLCPSWPIWGTPSMLSWQKGSWTSIGTAPSPLCAFALVHSSPWNSSPSHPKIHMKHSSCSRVPGQFLHLPRAFLALSRYALESLSPERHRVKLDQFSVPY